MFKTLLLIAVVTFAMFGAGSVKAQNNPAQANDKKLKIIKKPFPRTDGKCSERSGTAQVRATFDKSGVITAVEFVKSSGCDYYDKQSLQAARKIKFKPQVTNGETVTVVKAIQYTFSY